MSDYKKIADDLTNSLQLSQRPIAMSLHECAAFRRSRIQWRRSSRVLLLAASSGEHVFHIREGSRALLYRHPHTPSWRSRRPAYQSELQDALQAMSGLDYMRDRDEVAAIPVVQHEVRYVLYGPLVEFRTDPDVVLLVRPRPTESDSQRGR